MGEKRTKLQIDSNRLDMEIYRVIGMLDRFAEDYVDPEAADLSRTMFSSRGAIRKHMHPADRRSTI